MMKFVVKCTYTQIVVHSHLVIKGQYIPTANLGALILFIERKV